MAILYSISLRKVSVKDPETGERVKVKKGYAVAKARGTYDTDAFAKQLEASAGNNYQRTAFVAILADVAETARDIISQGYFIDCGNLGKFYPSLSSVGVYDASEFTPMAHIKKVYARWARPEKLANIQDPKPTYELLPTNEYADAGKQAAKQGKSTVQVRPIG